MATPNEKTELLRALQELVELWERYDCQVTSEQVRRISGSPYLAYLTARRIQKPRVSFVEELSELTACLKKIAMHELDASDLGKGLFEAGLDVKLIETIRRLSEAADLR